MIVKRSDIQNSVMILSASPVTHPSVYLDCRPDVLLVQHGVHHGTRHVPESEKKVTCLVSHADPDHAAHLIWPSRPVSSFQGNHSSPRYRPSAENAPQSESPPMQHGGGKGNWGAVDKAGLHSTPDVVGEALGPVPTTAAEKVLEPESALVCLSHALVA